MSNVQAIVSLVIVLGTQLVVIGAMYGNMIGRIELIEYRLDQIEETLRTLGGTVGVHARAHVK